MTAMLGGKATQWKRSTCAETHFAASQPLVRQRSERNGLLLGMRRLDSDLACRWSVKRDHLPLGMPIFGLENTPAESARCVSRSCMRRDLRTLVRRL